MFSLFHQGWTLSVGMTWNSWSCTRRLSLGDESGSGALTQAPYQGGALFSVSFFINKLLMKVINRKIFWHFCGNVYTIYFLWEGCFNMYYYYLFFSGKRMDLKLLFFAEVREWYWLHNSLKVQSRFYYFAVLFIKTHFLFIVYSLMYKL